MPKLINAKTGEPGNFTQEQLVDAVNSGEWKVDPSETYEFYDPAGSSHYYKGDNFASAVGLGYNLAQDTAHQIVASQNEADRAAEYSGVGSTIRTGVEGAARGLSLGLSDVALEGTGLSSAEGLRGRREEHPGVALGSEIGGAVLPAFFTGGGSAAGTAAKILANTPSALAMRAGARIAGLGAEAGWLGKGAAVAAGGFVENATFGAGQVISKMAMNDPELTAASALAEVGTAGLFGAGVSVGLPLAGAAIRRTSELAGETFGAVRSKLIREGAEDVLVGAAPAPPAPIDFHALGANARITALDIERQANLMREQTGNAFKATYGQAEVTPEVEAARAAYLQEARAATPVRREFSDFWSKPDLITNPSAAIDLTKRYIESQNRVADAAQMFFGVTVERVNPELVKGLETPINKIVEGLAAKGVQAAAVAPVVKPSIARWTLDKIGELVGFTNSTILSASEMKVYRNKILTSLNDVDTSISSAIESTDENVSNFLNDLAAFEGTPLRDQFANLNGWGNTTREVQAARDEFTELWLGKDKAVPLNEPIYLNDAAIKKFVGAEEAEATKMLEAALKYVTKSQQVLRQADEINGAISGFATQHAADLSARTIVESNLSTLRKSLNAIQTASETKLNIVDQLALADMMGFVNINSSDIPVVGPLVEWFLKARAIGKWTGKRFAKYRLNKQAAGLGMMNKGSETISKMESLVKGIGSKVSAGAKKLPPGPISVELMDHFHLYPQSESSDKDSFGRAADQIEKASSNLEAYKKFIHDQMPLDMHGQMAIAMVTQQARKVEFLNSVIPRDPRANPALGKPWSPSRVQLTTFLRHLSGTERPLEVFRKLAEDEFVSPEEIEAAVQVWPDLASQFSSLLSTIPPEQLQSISFKQKARIMKVTGLNLDDSLAPDFVQAMQTPPPPEEAQGSPTDLSKINLPGMAPTPSQALQAGNKPGTRQ